MPVSISGSGSITGVSSLTQLTKLGVTGILTATDFSGPSGGAADFPNGLTATTASFSGNLSVGGVLTYDDVTNIDSVGVVTARSGLHVTSGSVGIGTDSPSASHNLTVRSSNDTTFTNNPSNIFVAGTDTSGSGNSGAGINFGGRYRDDNGNATAFAVVSGIKENTTHNNWAGALTFATRTHGNTGGNQERLRITSTGDVGINCIPHSNAGVNLHIHGDNTTSEIRLTNTTTGTGANGSYIQQGGNTLYIGNTESGNTVFEVNGSERLRVTSDGKVRLPDNGKLTLGAGDDLQIWSDNTDQYIRGEQNQLIVRSNNLRLQSYLGENYIHCAMNNAVSLYYDNVKKLETTATGVEVSGATKTDTLEVTQEYPSIRPTLDLNFAATKTLDRRITFTRDGVGTYVDDMGIVKYASNNTPRFDHNPTTGESLGLLIEESRTNVATYSTDYTNAVYNKLSATVVDNQAVAPDGTTTADLLHPSSSGSGRGLEINSFVLGTGKWTTSLYVKSAGLSWIALYGVNGGARAHFDVSNGTKGSANGGGDPIDDWDIIDAGNGWYRCYITIDLIDNTGAEYFYIYFGSSDNSTTVTANGTDGVYIWGTQVEQGSFPTSYIPTSGSTVTRDDDNAVIKGTDFTDFYNETEGTLFAEFNTEVTSGNVSKWVMSMRQPDNNNNYIAMTTYNTTKQPITINNNGSPQAGITGGGNVVAGVFTRMVGSYKLNDVDAAVDGTLLTPDTNATMPTGLTQMDIGRGWTNSDQQLEGRIKSIKYYNKKLPDAQLQCLTQQ